MGAQDFTYTATGKTAQDAFDAATSSARHEEGHGGYTGTIAEKSSFKMVSLPEGKTVSAFIEECIMDDDHFCGDKWGPAACLKTGTNDFTFFGWASS